MGKSMGKKESRAEPKYFSVADVCKYFEQNPARLVDYVKSGLPRKRTPGTSIRGVHIAQLGRMVGVPLLYDGESCETLPEWAWVEPNKFKNINFVLLKAEKLFPSR